jgi:hypothetical protein
MSKKAKIAIIGGGVAGSSTALYLGSLGLDVTLIEKEESLISGPPFCHLHAGGNLYREISDAQCITLLKQSIDFLRFYPYIVDYRPTVIVLPKSDKSTPFALLPRLKLLSKEYQALIDADKNNEVLGKSKNYYKCYEKEEIQALKNLDLPSNKPQNSQEWMIAVAKHIDLEKVQFPLILVQEYGLNLFRLSAGISLSLEKLSSINLEMQSTVIAIEEKEQQKSWEISYQKDQKIYIDSFDYLINATGFRTGSIDDMLSAPCRAMVEFKSAYVSYKESYKDISFPEIVFHGTRGTPQGMGQFTPYPNGYFQLHAMTHEITLYKDGLVSNSPQSCQARLADNFLKKIEKAWDKEETEKRTTLAINHLANFIPSFHSAKVGSKPLFGAQQISGNDPSLRVAEVSFPLPHYARCEIIKVSSVVDMIAMILKELLDLGYIKKEDLNKAFITPSIKENILQNKAESIANARDYPKDLAHRTMPFL